MILSLGNMNNGLFRNMVLYFKVLQQTDISLYTDPLLLPNLRSIPIWS